MGKRNRIVRIPPGVFQALAFVGLLWVLLGWAVNLGVWIICLVAGAG